MGQEKTRKYQDAGGSEEVIDQQTAAYSNPAGVETISPIFKNDRGARHSKTWG
jgi:hypothetical protein